MVADRGRRLQGPRTLAVWSVGASMRRGAALRWGSKALRLWSTPSLSVTLLAPRVEAGPMNAHAVHERPRPSVTASSGSDSWALMEGRLVTARADDLLGEVSSRLARLLREVELPAEVTTAVRDTLTAVDAGRATIGTARRSLRS